MSELESGAGEGRLPAARPDVVFRELTEEWVLFDPVSQLMHVLNLTGAIVWAACDGETSLNDLMVEMDQAFAPPPEPEALLGDIHETVERFRSEGLLL